MFEIIALMLLSQQPIQSAPELRPVAEGIASYYTVASSGSVTASGERMRDDQFTCALKFGEFGDYFLIVAEDGKSVVCRLNDRGPFHKKRVVDLSEAAMRKISPKRDLARVKVYHLGAKPPGADTLRLMLQKR